MKFGGGGAAHSFFRTMGDRDDSKKSGGKFGQVFCYDDGGVFGIGLDEGEKKRESARRAGGGGESGVA